MKLSLAASLALAGICLATTSALAFNAPSLSRTGISETSSMVQEVGRRHHRARGHRLGRFLGIGHRRFYGGGHHARRFYGGRHGGGHGRRHGRRHH